MGPGPELRPCDWSAWPCGLPDTEGHKPSSLQYTFQLLKHVLRHHASWSFHQTLGRQSPDEKPDAQRGFPKVTQPGNSQRRAGQGPRTSPQPGRQTARDLNPCGRPPTPRESQVGVVGQHQGVPETLACSLCLGKSP